jgi:hypothetical protein
VSQAVGVNKTRISEVKKPAIAGSCTRIMVAWGESATFGFCGLQPQNPNLVAWGGIQPPFGF